MRKKFILFMIMITMCLTCMRPLSAYAFESKVSAPYDLHDHNSYCVLDDRTGKVISGENIHLRVYPASTTKIMTAMAIIEEAQKKGIALSTPITIKSSMLQGIVSSLTQYYVQPGEAYTLETLLNMTLVSSCADATYCAAIYVFGSTAKCITAMNGKVKALGLTRTSFDNVAGLDWDHNYTTAYDMAKITSYAMSNKTFANIVKKTLYFVRQADGTPGRYIYTTNLNMSNNNLQSSLYKVIGTKTGTTSGYVLASTAEDKDTHRVICTYFGCYSDYARFYDTKLILDKVFSNAYKIDLGVKQYSTPTMKSAVSIEEGLKVTWNKVSGVGKYRVYKKNTLGKWVKIADTDKNYYVDKKAYAGHTYRYTVKCLSPSGKQEASKADAKGITATYLKAPEMKYTQVTNSGIKVTWSASKGAEKYVVFRKAGSATTWTRIAVTTNTYYTDVNANLKNNTTYKYIVKAVKDTSKSPLSPKALIIKFYKAPKLDSIKQTSIGVKVTWNAVTGASRYSVLRRTAGGSWKEIAQTTRTYYSDKTVKTGITYFYTVKCISSTGKALSGCDSSGLKILMKSDDQTETEIPETEETQNEIPESDMEV